MENNAKAVLGLAALAGGVIVLSKRRRSLELASASIKIYDSEGNVVEANSPASLTEGASYTAVISITNQTTRAGELYPATFSVGITGDIGAIPNYHLLFGALDPFVEVFSAGQTIEYTYPFTVPDGTGGLTGKMWANVRDPNDLYVAHDEEDLNILALPIVYGASVVINT